MAYRGTGLIPFFGSSSPIWNLRREIDRLFEDTGMSWGGRWVPAADVREDDQAICIDLELAGINPSDVDITVDNGVLTVSGEKRTEKKEGQEGRYHSVERRYGSFVRSFQLPQGVDESKIAANFDAGVLTIEIPKTALPQPRRIQIGAPAGQEVQGRTGREQVSAGRSSTTTSSGEKMAASGSEREGSSSEGGSVRQ